MAVTNLLVKLFVKDAHDFDSPLVRTRYGVMSGSVGIVLNILLFAAKLLTGALTNSISITIDAFNNLSDAGSSGVTLVGFRLAGKPADKEHPFGHGRLEYVAALVVSFAILMMGVELIKASFDKILHPQPLVFRTAAVAILAASMAAKLWLAYFNRQIGRRIHSPAMSAVVADSLSDTAATGVTLIALIVSRYTDLPLDGYIGLLVAAFVFAAGIGILKETVGPLLGEPPAKELVQEIQQTILAYEGVVGIHDLILHNYGPGRLFGSVHAEVCAEEDIMKSHDTIDLIERDIKGRFGVDMVIHMDPLVTDDARVNALCEMTEKIVRGIDETLSIHDFRVVDGPTHTNLIFDLVTPYGYKAKSAALITTVCDKISESDSRCFAVITVEQSFLGN